MSVKEHNTDPTEENWDREWKKYNKRPYFKPNHRIIKVISECFQNKLKGKRIVELGAGSGSDIISLVQKGAEGYALDFSRESIQTIQYWAKEKKVKITTIRSDIRKIPYLDNFFDMVYSVGLMEHFKNFVPYLQEQIRVIKPGGFLLIDVPQKFTLYTIAKHIRMWRNTHPFGWETEFSKGDLMRLAQKLNQQVYLIYGRDSDIISRLPFSVRTTVNKIFSSTIEKSSLAPHICLCIGLVLKVKK